MKLLLLTTALLVGLKSQSCDCDDGKDFIRATGKCEAYPKSGETGFVQNCDNYNYDNKLKKWICHTCNVQYYVDVTGSSCTDGGIQNCDEYYDATNCEGCTDGFYLDSNACVANPSTPANCKRFRQEASGAQCWLCQKGYYLQDSDKTCVQNPSTVAGCLVYEDNNGTVECDQCDYNVYDGLDGQTCYKIGDKVTDCESGYDQSSGVYRCSRCVVGKMVEDKGAASDVCVANPTSEADGMKQNCKQYEKSSNGVVSCVRCNDHFGLKQDGTCEDVGTGKVENCKKYELVGSAWKCDYCNDEYYSNVDYQSNPTVCDKCPVVKKKNSSSIQITVSLALYMLIALLF